MVDLSKYTKKELLDLRLSIDKELKKRKEEQFYSDVENEIETNGYYSGLSNEKLNTLYNYRSITIPVIVGASCRSMDSRDIDEHIYFNDISDDCTVPEQFIGNLDKIKTKDIKITSEWTCDSYDDDYRARGKVTCHIYYKPNTGLCYDLDNDNEVYIHKHENKYYLYKENSDSADDNLPVPKEIHDGQIYKFVSEILDYNKYIPIVE